METLISIHSTQKEEIYKEIIPQIQSLLSGESDLVANLANVCGVLKMSFRSVSWVGFYLYKRGELVLGPFQGKPACVRIKLGKGVCGTAAEHRKTIVVQDVSKFPGHIFCDPDSKSEIVVPVFDRRDLYGVLDLDSSDLSTFDAVDQKYLEQIVKILLPKFSDVVN
ncbi:MAG: GAF domain-containing protein [Bacteroidota bacterium]